MGDRAYHRLAQSRADALTLGRRLVRSLAVLLLLIVVSWTAGLLWFVSDLDRAENAPDIRTDAIVVLTGGSLRIDHGLALLRAGTAKKLFISGVHQAVDPEEMERRLHIEPDLVQCCVVLGHAAADTAGNARETAQWLQDEGCRSVRLVTANYHMRRALLEFRRALPPEITIVPDAVAPDATRPDRNGAWRGLSPVVAVEYSKYLGVLAWSWVAPQTAAP